MKKKLLLSCILLITIQSIGQEKIETETIKKNEIKGNALLLVSGFTEITYERILDKDSGIGVSAFYTKIENTDIKFSLTPYYRVYFGKKNPRGFYIESFGMLNTGERKDQFYNDNGFYSRKTKYTDFALGFGLGAKWIHRKGFVFEFGAGIGRNLIESSSPPIVGRGGISFGYQF